MEQASPLSEQSSECCGIAGIVNEEIQPGERHGCQTPDAEDDEDPGKGVDPAVEKAREAGMDEDDSAEQLALHFLAEVDIAWPESDAAQDAVPGFAGGVALGRGKDAAEEQDDECRDAEHSEIVHDLVDDVGRMRGLGSSVLQAD